MVIAALRIGLAALREVILYRTDNVRLKEMLAVKVEILAVSAVE